MYDAVSENNVELLKKNYNSYTKLDSFISITHYFICLTILYNSIGCYEFFKEKHLDIVESIINFEGSGDFNWNFTTSHDTYFLDEFVKYRKNLQGFIADLPTIYKTNYFKNYTYLLNCLNERGY